MHIRCRANLFISLFFLTSIFVDAPGEFHSASRGRLLGPLDCAVVLGVVCHLLEAVHLEYFTHVLVFDRLLSIVGLGPTGDSKSLILVRQRLQVINEQVLGLLHHLAEEGSCSVREITFHMLQVVGVER